MRLLLIPLLLLFATAAHAQSPDAAALMEKSRATTVLRGAEMQLTFTLVSANGSERIRKVTSWSRADASTGVLSRRTRYDYPPADRGLTSLLVEHAGRDDEMWVYVPAIKKTRRLVANSQRESFMGTVLSYGDVLGHRPAAWQHRVLGQDVFEGKPCTRVESLPANDTVRQQTGYSRRVSCLDAVTAFNWRMEVWDEQGVPLKRIENRDVRPVAEQPGVFLAYDITAVSLRDGERTRLVMERFRFAPELTAEAFSAAALATVE